MTTPDPYPAADLTSLALAMGEEQDRGRDAPAALRAAVLDLDLSEQDQHLLTDVVLVAHGLLVGYDASPGLLDLWGPARVTAAATLAIDLLGASDGPSPT